MDVFLQRFDNGDAADADAAVILAALGPFSSEPLTPDSTAFVTADGAADVYGLDSGAGSIMISHASGEVIWDAVFAAAEAASLAIMPAGSPVCVPRPELLDDLPKELREGARVVSSGREVLQSIVE